MSTSPLPKQAMLLAAGFGSRMSPLSFDRPKPLMPLWDIPLIEHTLQALVNWGVESVLINLHHHAEAIRDHFARTPHPEIQIQFSFEPQILGTGGALRHASWFINAPCWIINTDIAFDIDPRPLAHDFHHHHSVATLWMCRQGPRTVELNHDGTVHTFVSRNPGATKTLTFSGLQIISPRILDWIPAKPFSSIIEAYRHAQHDGYLIRGCELKQAFWADTGTPERYLACHKDVLNAMHNDAPGKRLLTQERYRILMQRIPHTTNISPPVCIGRNTQIAPHTHLSNSVLWEHSSITPNSKIDSVIAGTNSQLSGFMLDSTAIQARFARHDAIGCALSQWRRKTETWTRIQLPARGSNRRFERIITPNRKLIAIHYNATDRPENARYTAHSNALAAHHIHVPKVLFDDPSRNVTLLEDVGECSLQDMLPSMDSRARIKIYRQTLDQITRWHAIPLDKLPPMEPPFNRQLFNWEHSLFFEHTLGHLIPASSHERRAIKQELQEVAKHLTHCPQVALHRDLQSSNIYIYKKKAYFIDFQGMRPGPAAYDLASLLCDPYAMLPEQERSQLRDYYLDRQPHRNRISQQDFTYAAIQRLTQALGAYGRLAATPATTRFQQYIPKAAQMLIQVSQTTAVSPIPKLTHCIAKFLRANQEHRR